MPFNFSHQHNHFWYRCSHSWSVPYPHSRQNCQNTLTTRRDWNFLTFSSTDYSLSNSLCGWVILFWISSFKCWAIYPDYVDVEVFFQIICFSWVFHVSLWSLWSISIPFRAAKFVLLIRWFCQHEITIVFDSFHFEHLAFVFDFDNAIGFPGLSCRIRQVYN